MEQAQEVRLGSLAEELERVYKCVLRGAPQGAEVDAAATAGFYSTEPCIALERLQGIFELSPFERDLLLLCAGMSLEPRFANACAAAHKNSQIRWPTFGMGLLVLDEPHWSCLSRNRPLRYWRLLEMDSGSIMNAPLRIDERVLQYLIGVPSTDERLEPLLRAIPMGMPGNQASPDPVEASAIHRITRLWRSPGERSRRALLVGSRGSSLQSLFVEACSQVGLRPFVLDAADIPSAVVDREMLARLWTRESAMTSAGLYVRTQRLESFNNLSAWLDLVETPIAVEVQTGSLVEHLEGVRVHLPKLSSERRKKLWTDNLGKTAERMDGHLDRIVEHFHFDEPSIRLSAIASLEESSESGEGDAGRRIWRICREHARRSLENLAQRVEPRGEWEDLVLPATQIEILHQIVNHVRQSATVHEKWGFASKFSRGLGLSALFSGSSGTGKTMAAEILARELDLDLYRIDLSCVVSKYIGETEKNLRKIFDAAEESGALLLFDEADALFGKRSEVRDSHDRYANLEISYLLQRIETYRGVAILTTNMQFAIDDAFLRRIRFIVHFPFPDSLAREQIWKRIFPSATPIGSLDPRQLAQLNISGGVIRNIAMHAAFLAAEDHKLVEVRHVLAAAKSEYSKMEVSLTAAETRGLV
jgi:hypothetical protein